MTVRWKMRLMALFYVILQLAFGNVFYRLRIRGAFWNHKRVRRVYRKMNLNISGGLLIAVSQDGVEEFEQLLKQEGLAAAHCR